MRTWALELECAKMDEQRRKKACVKKWILIPLYGQTKLCVPTSLVKLAYLPSAVINGSVGLLTPVLMRIPEKGDTISGSTRRAKETASLNALRWDSKNDSNKGLAVV